mgnify:CR=1 FL=1
MVLDVLQSIELARDLGELLHQMQAASSRARASVRRVLCMEEVQRRRISRDSNAVVVHACVRTYRWRIMSELMYLRTRSRAERLSSMSSSSPGASDIINTGISLARVHACRDGIASRNMITVLDIECEPRHIPASSS